MYPCVAARFVQSTNSRHAGDTAEGQGGNGSYEYQIHVKGDAKSGIWQLLQGYLATNMMQWDTTGYAGGNRLQSGCAAATRRIVIELGYALHTSEKEGILWWD